MGVDDPSRICLEDVIHIDRADSQARRRPADGVIDAPGSGQGGIDGSGGRGAGREVGRRAPRCLRGVGRVDDDGAGVVAGRQVGQGCTEVESGSAAIRGPLHLR
jgi:hypothetical protein